MKRVWLRWALMGLFVVALGFTFVSLGQWQLDRLEQRRQILQTQFVNMEKAIGQLQSQQGALSSIGKAG